MFRSQSGPDRKLRDLADAIRRDAPFLSPRLERRSFASFGDLDVVLMDPVPGLPRQLAISRHRREWVGCWINNGSSVLGFEPLIGAEGNPDIPTVCEMVCYFILGTYDTIIGDADIDTEVTSEVLVRRRRLEMAVGAAPTPILPKTRHEPEPTEVSTTAVAGEAVSAHEPGPATVQPGELVDADPDEYYSWEPWDSGWGLVGEARDELEGWLRSNGLPELDDLLPPTEIDTEFHFESWFDAAGRLHRVFGPAYRSQDGALEEWYRHGEACVTWAESAAHPQVTLEIAMQALEQAESVDDRAWVALVLLNNASPSLGTDMRRLLRLLALDGAEPKPPATQPWEPLGGEPWGGHGNDRTGMWP